MPNAGCGQSAHLERQPRRPRRLQVHRLDAAQAVAAAHLDPHKEASQRIAGGLLSIRSCREAKLMPNCAALWHVALRCTGPSTHLPTLQPVQDRDGIFKL